jgi:hypothetical protein
MAHLGSSWDDVFGYVLMVMVIHLHRDIKWF